jgi:hypothetical protein
VGPCGRLYSLRNNREVIQSLLNLGHVDICPVSAASSQQPTPDQAALMTRPDPGSDERARTRTRARGLEGERARISVSTSGGTHQQSNNTIRIKDKVASTRVLVPDDRIQRLELRGLSERDHVGRDRGRVGLRICGGGRSSRHLVFLSVGFVRVAFLG